MYSTSSWFFAFFVVLFFGAPSFCSDVHAAKHDWRWWASRLTLGDETRRDALHHLQLTPHLEKQLQVALLTDDKFLAFDAIAALKLHSFLPELLSRASQNNDDGSEYFYLAIDSLLETSDLKKISVVYQERLFAPETCEAARVVILDTLSRMPMQLTSSDLQKLITAKFSPELRKAALSYLRDSLLDTPRASDLAILRRLLSDPEATERFRLQALFLSSELSQQQFRNLGNIKLTCSRNFPHEIQLVCQRLARN